MTLSLHGKVTIITGGARGIGAAIARMFACAGSDIVINYRVSDERAEALKKELKNLGRRVLLLRGGIENRHVAKELIRRTIDQFGKIDCVVNNAGILTSGMVGSLGEKVWDETLQVNLKGTFNVCEEAVPSLTRNPGSRIINIASSAGQSGRAYYAHYAASKGGILAFTRSLALELAPYNVLVNAISPDWVDTEMNTAAFSTEQHKDLVQQTIPLNRLATADDIAGVALFLASPLANYITGATIDVNGGRMLA